MRELFRIPSSETKSGLILGIATTADEIEALQRLRFNVYTQELGAVFPDAVDGVDKDRFDEFCDHLMVCDVRTQQVVGTYRMMSPDQAVKAGGYYAESEFDLSHFAAIRPILSECGRACTHADYRGGATVMLLWMGLAQYMRMNNYRYMLGCASVSLADGGLQAAEVWRSAKIEMAKSPDLQCIQPLEAYPLEQLEAIPPSEDKVKIPPLIKGYLKVGARICGEPAWDRHFNTADFPVMIDFQCMDSRYRKHFGIEG